MQPDIIQPIIYGRMPFISTPLAGLFIFEPKVFEDDRGYFFESFNERTFMREAGVEVHFVQDNQALSAKGVFRGLHFQQGDAAQAKLVRVLSGEVYDIVVDIREDSPTRGQAYGIVLSASNRLQLFIPRGFAHGYLVLSDTAEFFYKCDNYYQPAAESGYRFDDPAFQLDLPVLPDTEYIVAPRDKNWPLFQP